MFLQFQRIKVQKEVENYTCTGINKIENKIEKQYTYNLLQMLLHLKTIRNKKNLKSKTNIRKFTGDISIGPGDNSLPRIVT